MNISNNKKVLKREMLINGTKIHIKSIFTEQTQLDEALKKIVIRRMSEDKKAA